MDFIRPFTFDKPYRDDDYRMIREVLKAFSAERLYFAYCPEDDTLIWHRRREPWCRDDDGSQFIAFATLKGFGTHARAALHYVKHSCYSLHIDAATKAKRLGAGA